MALKVWGKLEQGHGHARDQLVHGLWLSHLTILQEGVGKDLHPLKHPLVLASLQSLSHEAVLRFVLESIFSNVGHNRKKAKDR